MSAYEPAKRLPSMQNTSVTGERITWHLSSERPSMCGTLPVLGLSPSWAALSPCLSRWVCFVSPSPDPVLGHKNCLPSLPPLLQAEHGNLSQGHSPWRHLVAARPPTSSRCPVTSALSPSWSVPEQVGPGLLSGIS